MLAVSPASGAWAAESTSVAGAHELPMASGGTAQAVAPDERILDPQALAAAEQAEADLAGSGAATSTGTAMTGLTLPATAAQEAPAEASAAAASTNPVKLCKTRFPGYTLYQWRMVTNPGMRPQMFVPVQKVVTKGRLKAKYEWSNTKETTTTTGLALSYSGTKIEGGLSKSVVNRAGNDFDVPTNDKYELQATWEYRWYDLYCQDPATLPTTPWKDAKITELRPYQFAGGARKVNTTGYSCNNSSYRQHISAGDSSWVSRSTTHSMSNSISYGGWNLNASQKNTGDHKKTFTNTSTVSADVCGENALPTKTDRVSEV